MSWRHFHSNGWSSTIQPCSAQNHCETTPQRVKESQSLTSLIGYIQHEFFILLATGSTSNLPVSFFSSMIWLRYIRGCKNWCTYVSDSFKGQLSCKFASCFHLPLFLSIWKMTCPTPHLSRESVILGFMEHLGSSHGGKNSSTKETMLATVNPDRPTNQPISKHEKINSFRFATAKNSRS